MAARYVCIFETHRGSGFCRQVFLDQVFSGRDNKRCRHDHSLPALPPAPAHFQLPLIWLSCRKFCICLFSQLPSFQESWVEKIRFLSRVSFRNVTWKISDKNPYSTQSPEHFVTVKFFIVFIQKLAGNFISLR